MAQVSSRQAVYTRAFRLSPTFFGKHFWGKDGDMFYVEFGEFHRQAMAMAMGTKKDLAIVIPRGFGKTKMFSVLYVVWSIIFAKEPYIMIVSASSKKARQILRDVEALVKHPKFIRVFGDFESRSPEWNRDKKIFIDKKRGINSIVQCQGSESQILGASEGDSRITLAILDDIMSEEEAANIERCQKLEAWWNRSLKPAMAKIDRRGRKGRILVIGTPFEPQDFMTMVMGWTDIIKVIRFPALDKNDESIWPQMWTTEELHEERESYVRRGALSAFLSQYQLETQAEQAIKFPADKIVKIKSSKIPKILKSAEGVYIHVDAAYTQKTYSDYVGITVSALSEGSVITCIEAFRGKIDANALFDKIWELQEKYGLVNYRGVFIETKVFNLMQSFFRERGVRENKIIDLKPMIWMGEAGEEKKVNRINTLIPYTHLGNVRLIEGLTMILEMEMLSYDGRKKKGLDTLDSFANNVPFLTISSIEASRDPSRVSLEQITPDDHYKRFVETQEKNQSMESSFWV